MSIIINLSGFSDPKNIVPFLHAHAQTTDQLFIQVGAEHPSSLHKTCSMAKTPAKMTACYILWFGMLFLHSSDWKPLILYHPNTISDPSRMIKISGSDSLFSSMQCDPTNIIQIQIQIQKCLLYLL